MERNVLLTVTLICIVVAGVGGQSPASSPTKSPDAPSTPTTSPSSPPVEAPKSPSPVTSSPPPASVPESAPPSPPPKASAPVRSPPASVPEAATPPAPVADAPAPSKGKKHQNATAPAPELDSPPSPPMEAPGPSSDAVSPGPATSANEKSGAESTSVLRNLAAVGAAATAWAVLILSFAKDLNPPSQATDSSTSNTNMHDSSLSYFFFRLSSRRYGRFTGLSRKRKKNKFFGIFWHIGVPPTQMMNMVMGSLYKQFTKKAINNFDDFHVAVLDIFNNFNSALPGRHFDLPTPDEIKARIDLFNSPRKIACFLGWKEAKDEEEKKKVFTEFIAKKVKPSKLDDVTMITGIASPPAAMAAKRAGENIPQLKFIKLIPDVIFVPTVLFLDPAEPHDLRFPRFLCLLGRLLGLEGIEAQDCVAFCYLPAY
ncbi:hypothetical protein YC2023_000163 [Brassica napus]